MSSVDKSTIEDLQEDSSLKKCFDRAGKQITGENDVGEFFMKNGLLYQEHQETKMGRSSNQLVVPKGLRQQMIGLSVNQESANQLGAKMTEVRIHPNFFWPGLYSAFLVMCAKEQSKGYYQEITIRVYAMEGYAIQEDRG